MQMKGPQLRADRFFFFPCPRHFCCCLTGFPGDLDQHFHNRVSKAWLPPPSHPRAAWGGGQSQPSRAPAFAGGRTGSCCWLQRLSPTEHWAHLEPGWLERLAWGKAGPRPPAWAASMAICCSQVLTLENWLLCTGSNFSMLFNTCYCIHIVKGPHPVLIQGLDTESLWCYKHHFSKPDYVLTQILVCAEQTLKTTLKHCDDILHWAHVSPGWH